MSRLLRRHVTYANIVATIALFLALGGTAYAALVITGANVKNGTLTGADVKDRSLLGRDFARGQLPAGAPGAAGAAGAPGAPGTPGTTGATGAAGSPDTASQVLAKLLGVDGAGSSLDADTLGGRDASDLQRAYRRTIVVGGEASAAANGDALLAALADIDDNAATKRYLVQMEPGTFDIGAATITMKPWVDLAGSGATATVITSEPTSGFNVVFTIGDGQRTELRDLAVRTTSTGNTFMARVFGGSHLTMRRIDANVETTEDERVPRILQVSGASTATIFDSSFEVQHTAVTQGQPLSVSGAGSVLALHGSDVRDPSSNAFMLSVSGAGLARVQNSTLTTPGTALTAYSGGVVEVDASRIDGRLQNVDGVIRVGASRLTGPFVGSMSCVASYLASYAGTTNCS